VDLGQRVGQCRAGRPVAGDAGYFAAREDLADGQVAPVFLRDQEAAEVDVEDLWSWGGEAAPLGFEEVTEVAAGAAGESDFREGGGAPDDVGFR